MSDRGRIRGGDGIPPQPRDPSAETGQDGATSGGVGATTSLRQRGRRGTGGAVGGLRSGSAASGSTHSSRPCLARWNDMDTCSSTGCPGEGALGKVRRRLTDSSSCPEAGVLPVGATARGPRRPFAGVSRCGPSPIGAIPFPGSSKRTWSPTPVNAPVAGSRRHSHSRTWRVAGPNVWRSSRKRSRSCAGSCPSICVALIRTTCYIRKSRDTTDKSPPAATQAVKNVLPLPSQWASSF